MTRTGAKSDERQDWRRLFLLALKVSRNADRSADIVQSAYVRLGEYCRGHRVDNEPAFLTRVVANIAIDQRRAASRQPRCIPLDEALSAASDAPLQDEILAARLQLERVNQVLSRLPPRTRTIFLMHRLDGAKYREIAAQFDISVSAVEKHIAKALVSISRLSRD